MKNKEDDFDVSRYVADISAAIVNEIFAVVQEEARMRGDSIGQTLSMSIIRNTVFVLVYNCLTNIDIPENTSPEDAEVIIRNSYSNMKDDIQNAIADGFEAASQKFSGVSTGYYCKIATAGKPVNALAI